MKDLVKSYEKLKNGDVIRLVHDNIECVVVENRIDCNVFLQRTDDHSKFFHIFYDEICTNDDFTVVDTAG